MSAVIEESRWGEWGRTSASASSLAVLYRACNRWSASKNSGTWTSASPTTSEIAYKGCDAQRTASAPGVMPHCGPRVETSLPAVFHCSHQHQSCRTTCTLALAPLTPILYRVRRVYMSE